ncbi:MAG: hypothetical protein V8S32_09600 [Lachnospiraceae bacterium]
MEKHSDVAIPEREGDLRRILVGDLPLPLGKASSYWIASIWAMNQLVDHHHSCSITVWTFWKNRASRICRICGCRGGYPYGSSTVRRIAMESHLVGVLRHCTTGMSIGLPGWTDPDDCRTFPWNSARPGAGGVLSAI